MRSWLGRRLLIAWVMLSSVIALLGLFFWLRAGLAGTLGGTDFLSFYATSRVLLTEGPAHVYDLAAQRQVQTQLGGSGTLPFLPDPYPPYWILARCWLALLPLRWAYLVWGLLTIAATGGALFLLARVADLKGRRAWPTLIAAGFPPVVLNLLQGQPVAFLLLGIALSLWFWSRGRETLAGAALALLLIKPQIAGLLLALVVLHRSFRALAGLMLAVAALAAASLTAFGATGVTAWLKLLGADQGAVFRPWLSLRAPLVALRLTALDQYVWLALLGGAILVVMALARLDLRGSFATATAGGLLIAPHLNLHDLTLLIVPAILIVGTARGRLITALGYFAAAAAIWLAPAALLAEVTLGGGALTARWRAQGRR